MAEERVRVRRVYEEPEPDDGARVLVDRIWPRGLTRAKAALDEWCKHVAPSDELRKWYGHDPGRFEEFGHEAASCSGPEHTRIPPLCATEPVADIAGRAVTCDLPKGHPGPHLHLETGWQYQVERPAR